MAGQETGAKSGEQTRLGVAGTYRLRFQIGDVDMSLSPASYYSIDIFEYIDRALPAFSVTFNDPMGILTHRTLIDSKYNKVSIQFGLDTGDSDQDKPRDMTFRIYRRAPEMATSGLADTITLSGLLDVPNMFSPCVQRGWYKKSIRQVITDVAGDFGATVLNIEHDLTAPITVVQPNWPNITFLQYLADKVARANTGTGHFVFMDTMEKGQARLNFRSIKSMLQAGQGKYVFVLGKTPMLGLLPIFNFEIVDNFEVMHILGTSKQAYSYFDWLKGEQFDEEISIDQVDFTSLCKYFAYDPVIGTDSVDQIELGSLNDLVPDWRPVLQGRYSKKLNSLVKQWITTQGLPEIRCGNLIKIAFSDDAKSMVEYQYTGWWLVEKIIHHIASTYTTKLLLTRSGVDADPKESTTLKMAGNWKR